MAASDPVAGWERGEARAFGAGGEAFAAQRADVGPALLEHVRALSPGAAAGATVQRAVSVLGPRAGAAAVPIRAAWEDAEDGFWLAHAVDPAAGETLAERVERVAPSAGEAPASRRFDDAELHAIGDALLASLAALHHANVVHLGITPRNVWIEPPHALDPPSKLSARFIDVGLHVEPAGGAGAIHHLGFWPFAAPEQLLRSPASFAADVYAAATVLYRLWSGQLPHRAKNALELVELRRAQAPRPLSETLGRAIPHDLDVWFLNALSTQPERRPSAAAAHAEWRRMREAALRAPTAKSGMSDELLRARQLDVLGRLCERLQAGEAPLPTDLFQELTGEVERRIDLDAIARAWEEDGAPPSRQLAGGASGDTVASSELSPRAKADLLALDPDDRKAVHQAVAQAMIDPVARGVEPLGDPENHLRVRVGDVRVLYVVRGGVLFVVRVTRGA